MTLQVITFPGAQVSDIPACLRDLAENIEAGNFGDCGMKQPSEQAKKIPAFVACQSAGMRFNWS